MDITLLQPDFEKTSTAENQPWDAWLVFVGNRILPSPDEGFLWDKLPVPQSSVLQSYNLGTVSGRTVTAVEVAEQEVLPEALSLRSAILQCEESSDFLLHQAGSLLNWGRHYRFCPSCQSPLSISDSVFDRGRGCNSCDFRVYPAVSPCVIVLIHNEDRVLLARGLRHPPGFRSLIAGFVEPGESLEQTVAREVMEEVGLEVDNVRYQHSQPWPFPHNLMMGFHARYKSGDIQVDAEELEEADWYPLSNLPQLPPPQTIAWQLIDKYQQSFGLS